MEKNQETTETTETETVETKQVPEIKPKGFELVQQPTEFALMVQTPEGEVITPDQLMVDIANEVRAIKKGIVG